MQMSSIPWVRWLNVNIGDEPDGAYLPRIKIGGDKKHPGIRWKGLILKHIELPSRTEELNLPGLGQSY